MVSVAPVPARERRRNGRTQTMESLCRAFFAPRLSAKWRGRELRMRGQQRLRKIFREGSELVHYAILLCTSGSFLNEDTYCTENKVFRRIKKNTYVASLSLLPDELCMFCSRAVSSCVTSPSITFSQQELFVFAGLNIDSAMARARVRKTGRVKAVCSVKKISGHRTDDRKNIPVGRFCCHLQVLVRYGWLTIAGLILSAHVHRKWTTLVP